MVVSGHVKDNRILLDSDIHLPDGIRVEIILPDDAIAQSSGLCGIWKDDRSADEIVAELVKSRSVGREITS
jgi:hypothetical protein